MSITVALVTAALLVIVMSDLRDARAAADRLKRVRELEARETQLYEQLAQKDAQREAQRRIYIDRIRKREAEVRAHVQEIAVLRARAAVDSTTVGLSPMSRD